MQLLPVLKGLATRIPFLYRADRGATGGTVSARYCYSIWMRHLVLLSEAGLPTTPDVVAELGPGDSLGIGLASMLCGAQKLLALDVVRYANKRRNHEILDELVGLFTSRAAIPDDREFPDVFPRLANYAFPSAILGDKRLVNSLTASRVDALHRALDGAGAEDAIQVRYVVPWDQANAGDQRSADLIFSQAVLEHVEHLGSTYPALARLLAPGGVMSHVIDFRSHKITRDWDGHLQYSDWWWDLVKGKRPYLLNRKPLSMHCALLEQNGFQIEQLVRDVRAPTASVPRSAAHLAGWTPKDRETASAVVISRLRA